MFNYLYMNLYRIIFLLSFLFVLCSCDKEKKLHDNVDKEQVNFLVTLPSLSMAQFAVECINYDIVLDSIIFLSPENTVYIQDFRSDSLNKDEAFLAGSCLPEDGLWILNFKGRIQLREESFSSSVHYIMNLDDDDDEK